MIPKVFHFIFFGPIEFNYTHYLSIKSAAAIHKPEKIFLYYDNRRTENPLWNEIESLVELIRVDPPEEFNGVKLHYWQYKADILRLQKLIEHGGIYFDIDIISLKPIDKLLNNYCVMGVESGGNTLDTAESVSNAVIMTEPNNQFLIDWLKKTGENLEGKHWAYHAVNLPVEMLRTQQYNVHLEPLSSFMSFGWKDKWVFESENEQCLTDSYTMHLWETIWKDDLRAITPEYIQTSNSTFASVIRNLNI